MDYCMGCFWGEYLYLLVLGIGLMMCLVSRCVYLVGLHLQFLPGRAGEGACVAYAHQAVAVFNAQGQLA